MNQRAIEDAAGIDDAVAKHMMAKETEAARSAMSLLQMQCNSFDHGGFALLKSAVSECRAEIAKQ